VSLRAVPHSKSVTAPFRVRPQTAGGSVPRSLCAKRISVEVRNADRTRSETRALPLARHVAALAVEPRRVGAQKAARPGTPVPTKMLVGRTAALRTTDTTRMLHESPRRGARTMDNAHAARRRPRDTPSLPLHAERIELLPPHSGADVAREPHAHSQLRRSARPGPTCPSSPSAEATGRSICRCQASGASETTENQTTKTHSNT